MFENKVNEFIERHRLITAHDVVVVGVSGGPDSLALLHYLHEKKDLWSLRVVAAHLDHMFRGDESYNELLFVQSYCEQHDIPFYGRQISVKERTETVKGSLQEKARIVRYDFFHDVMKSENATVLALGHHGDDQIETIVMRLTRGSTGEGRAGIPFKRPFGDGQVVRPFLCVTKDEIEAYCFRHNLQPRRDPSNEKEDYTRNRVRKRILPALKDENVAVHRHFQSYSEELLEDEAFLKELSIQKLNTVWSNKEDYGVLDILEFLNMPLPLQRRLIQLILNYLYKEPPVSLSSVHIYSILEIIRGEGPNKSLDLPKGLKVTRSYRQCIFHFGTRHNEPYHFFLSLMKGEEVVLPDGSKFYLSNTDTTIEAVAKDEYVYIDERSLPLRIRTRKSGDRIKVRGLDGTKKVKKLFIDHKIPLHKRDQWPIVVDHKDQILWVPGLQASHSVHLEQKDNTLLLQYIKKDLLGGS